MKYEQMNIDEIESEEEKRRQIARDCFRAQVLGEPLKRETETPPQGEKVKQTELVLMYLEQYGTITPVDAMREFGIMRLASRISDLKRAGFNIQRRMKQSTNRFGRPVHYAEYYVPVEEPKEAVSVGCTVGDEDCWGGDEDCWGGDVGTARTFFDTEFGGD